MVKYEVEVNYCLLVEVEADSAEEAFDEAYVDLPRELVMVSWSASEIES